VLICICCFTAQKANVQLASQRLLTRCDRQASDAQSILHISSHNVEYDSMIFTQDVIKGFHPFGVMWGLDINWRLNGFNCGKGGNCCPSNNTCDRGRDCCEYYYETNTTRLPNITDLFRFEHDLGLRVYLNDHPHNWAPETSPQEIAFRYRGLTKFLQQGSDFWWYDPNWHVGIKAPFNLEGHSWGAHVYTSILTHYNQITKRAMRPLMLGISGAMHASQHRYPVWWTGDDKGLSTSITTMVEFGIRHLKPHVHSDWCAYAPPTLERCST
jgi:hypothetical protein